jgi:hypothetical protein
MSLLDITPAIQVIILLFYAVLVFLYIQKVTQDYNNYL